MGTLFSEYKANCINVTGDATQDQDSMNKLYGGIQHDTQRFQFNIVGVDLNFSDLSLAPTGVVSDTDRPHNVDVASEMSIDQQMLGVIANDYTPDLSKQDLHGSGAVYKEYASLVIAELLQLRYPLGQAASPDGGVTGQLPYDYDPANCLFPNALPANFDPTTFVNNMPAYCTGFEGFLTMAGATSANDPLNLGPSTFNAGPPATDIFSLANQTCSDDGGVTTCDSVKKNATNLLNYFKLGLKPGHQQVVFCLDPTGDLTNPTAGYQYCGLQDDSYGAAGDVFMTSFLQVQKIFGQGNLKNLPYEVQDVRFFFKAYVTAILKYFMWEGLPATCTGTGCQSTGQYHGRSDVRESQRSVL